MIELHDLSSGESDEGTSYNNCLYSVVCTFTSECTSNSVKHNATNRVGGFGWADEWVWMMTLYLFTHPQDALLWWINKLCRINYDKNKKYNCW